MMYGPDLKAFHIDGAVKDLGHLLNKQAHEEHRVKQRMFSDGYVPVLDIVPLVYTEYDPVKETFRYTITLYGVQVKDEPWNYEGWLNGRLIKATTGTRFERLSSHSGLT